MIGPPTLRCPTLRNPKVGLAKVGQHSKTLKLVKVGLAKVGHDRGPTFGAPPFGAGLAKVGQLELAKVGLAKVGSRGRHTHRGASTHDGAVLVEAWRRKERTYPEFLLPGSRARLVVLALETGGRWSSEALAFVRLLARAKARSKPQLMRKLVEQAWQFRWLSLLGCSAARSFASSLLELRGSGGSL